MSSSSAERNPVEQLAEEFAERHRRGERPSLTEYTEKYPQWAEQNWARKDSIWCDWRVGVQ
jgi:hypothetical protein